MNAFIKVTRCLLLALIVAPAFAQQREVADGNGRIIEEANFALPSFEQIPDRFKRLYPREALEKMSGSTELELIKIKYLSDGLKISGFIYKGKETTGKRLPAVIFNRGGVGEDTIISTQNFINLFEMHRYASEGFVVLASQYRGYDGGEGKDEVGGADTNDVLNLVQVARSLGYVDMERVFMFGFSRGAIMTLQAIHRRAPIRAAVVVGAPTDVVLSRQENQAIRELARTHWPGPESRLEEHIETRSAVRWAESLTVPLLIFHGGADPAVSTRHALELAQKIDAAGNLYELVIYAKDDHFVTQNYEDRLRKSVEWFKNPRTVSIAQPLRRAIRDKGVEAAIKLYQELKEQVARYDLSEPQLNALGYELLFAGQVKEAIEIFKLNVAAYPQGFNTYDSLAEALAVAGQKELAIKNYKKSLELNPQNANAVTALKKLEN